MAEEAWIPMGASVRGAKHLRDGRPNQDALQWVPRAGARGASVPGPVVMAVADGHGDARSPRSQRGSAFAVATGTDVLWRFVEKASTSENLMQVKRLAEDLLPRQIEKEWQRRVDEDLQRSPLTSEEVKLLSSDPSGEANPASGGAISPGLQRLAYGTTLVLSAVAKEFLIHLQIGDGDLLMIAEDGEVVEPVPPDAGLLGDQTLSLSREGAWQDFRLRFFARSRADPAMVWLSTDGFSKSYATADDFRATARELLGHVRDQGAQRVGEGLEAMLEATSRDGSGDDVTVGLVVRAPEARSSTSALERRSVALAAPPGGR